MVFRKTSVDLKERAISLYGQGHLSKDICRLFGFFERSLPRWNQKFHEHGGVVPPLNYCQGRPSKLDSAWIDDLIGGT